LKKKHEENIKHYPVHLETKVALLEQSIEHINQSLIEIKQDLKDFSRDVKSDFRWVIGMIVGLSAFMVSGFAGMLAVIAHGFHWF
jgi:phage-related protein